MKNRTRRDFIRMVGLAGTALFPLKAFNQKPFTEKRKPNIILFLADDLGYGETGCYGQKKINTPNIDNLAREGMRFTQHYSGSPVCAPSRCVLLTGKHTGHAEIRDNLEIEPEGQQPISTRTATLPRLLKAHGYTTAVIGKWGLGFPGSEGEPNNQGFDLFFGYNCQRHAHNHYPAYLWRNRSRVVIEGNEAKESGTQYAPDLMENEAIEFIKMNRERPFFLFYTTTVPHLALQVPYDSLAEYKGRWDETPYNGKKGYLPHQYPRAAYAAMVSRMDRTVGRFVSLIKNIRLDDDTIILFTSDNGPTFDVGGYDPEFFNGTGPLRGAKGSVYEGGIRIPMIVRWNGKIPRDTTTDHIAAFQDVMPTLLEIIGAGNSIPQDSDGVSYTPTLLTAGKQRQHEYIYMEFPSYGGQQMVRLGKWKGIRKNLAKEPEAPIELYNLLTDIGEIENVSEEYPEIVSGIREIMKKEHIPSKLFPFSAID